MKRPYSLTLCVITGMILTGVSRAAEVEAELGAYSAYVWRGLIVNHDPVMQPSLTVNAGGFSFNVWGNFDLTDQDKEFDAMQFSEIDLTVAYAWESESAWLETGVVNFMFPNWPSTGSDTSELFFTAGLDGRLEPWITLNYDFDQIEGFYLNLGIGHTVELGEKTEITLMATYGYGDSSYNSGYFEVDEAGAVDLVLGVSIAHSINDSTGITGTIGRMQLLDSSLKESVGERNDSETILSLSTTFSW